MTGAGLVRGLGGKALDELGVAAPDQQPDVRLQRAALVGRRGVQQALDEADGEVDVAHARRRLARALALRPTVARLARLARPAGRLRDLPSEAAQRVDDPLRAVVDRGA